MVVYIYLFGDQVSASEFAMEHAIMMTPGHRAAGKNSTASTTVTASAPEVKI